MTAALRPCQSSLSRPDAVTDAVVSISARKATTVQGTARIPRSRRATTLSWTTARASDVNGVQQAGAEPGVVEDVVHHAADASRPGAGSSRHAQRGQQVIDRPVLGAGS